MGRNSAGERIVQDFSGIIWTVREHERRLNDFAPDRALVFESESAARRVRRFPANWRELSDSELVELSGGT